MSALKPRWASPEVPGQAGVPGEGMAVAEAPALALARSQCVVHLFPAAAPKLGLEPGAEPDASAQRLAAARVQYWKKTRRWTLGLLLVWLLVTVVVSFFARELHVMVAGWPLSFWLATQGALGVYVLIVTVYAFVMDRLDAALEALGRPDLD
jgi:putative solute:sodium symporter small subunit